MPAPTTRNGRPRWLTILLLIVIGALLGLGGCGMFLETFSGSSFWNTVGALMFIAGCLLVLIGGLTGIVYVVSAVFEHTR